MYICMYTAYWCGLCTARNRQCIKKKVCYQHSIYWRKLSNKDELTSARSCVSTPKSARQTFSNSRTQDDKPIITVKSYFTGISRNASTGRAIHWHIKGPTVFGCNIKNENGCHEITILHRIDGSSKALVCRKMWTRSEILTASVYRLSFK